MFLPDGLGAVVDLDAWQMPDVFAWLRSADGIEDAEMLKNFNSGIGMAVVVAADRADTVEQVLADAGETVCRLGHVTTGQGVSYQGTLS